MDLELVVQLLCPLTFGLVLSESGRLRWSKLLSFAVASASGMLYVILMWPYRMGYSLVWLVGYPIILLAIAWLLAADTFRRKVQFVAGYSLITIAAQFSANIFGVLFMGVELQSGQPLFLRYLVLALRPIFIMSYSGIFVAYYNRIEKTIRRRIVLLMLLLLSSQSTFTAGMSWHSGEQITEGLVLYMMLCELICVLVQYSMFETISSSVTALQNRMALENLRLKQEMNEKYIRMARETTQQMNSLRNDFQAQLQVAYSLAIYQPETAVAFMGEMERKLEEVRPIRWCSNTIINTIMSIKAADAENAGIRFSADVGVGNWDLDETDLSSVFLNLLDNAIEGCQRSGCPAPEVHLVAGERSGFYVVKVVNDCSPDLCAAEKLTTSKADRDHHGLGLSILRAIAEKYDGRLTVCAIDGRFEAKIALAVKLTHNAVKETQKEGEAWNGSTCYISSTYYAQ